MIARLSEILYDSPPLVHFVLKAYHPLRVVSDGTGLDSDAALRRGFPMKQGIHPKYVEITANCSCGNVIKTHSTVGHDLNLDVCGECHPFYTGKQREVATGGRVDRFNKRFSVPGSK